jgi:hypothetical protein
MKAAQTPTPSCFEIPRKPLVARAASSREAWSALRLPLRANGHSSEHCSTGSVSDDLPGIQSRKMAFVGSSLMSIMYRYASKAVPA